MQWSLACQLLLAYGTDLRNRWNFVYFYHIFVYQSNIDTSGALLFVFESTTTYNVPIRSITVEIWAFEVCGVALFFDCTLSYFWRPVRHLENSGWLIWLRYGVWGSRPFIDIWWNVSLGRIRVVHCVWVPLTRTTCEIDPRNADINY